MCINNFYQEDSSFGIDIHIGEPIFEIPFFVIFGGNPIYSDQDVKLTPSEFHTGSLILVEELKYEFSNIDITSRYLTMGGCNVAVLCIEGFIALSHQFLNSEPIIYEPKYMDYFDRNIEWYRLVHRLLREHLLTFTKSMPITKPGVHYCVVSPENIIIPPKKTVKFKTDYRAPMIFDKSQKFEFITEPGIELKKNFFGITYKLTGGEIMELPENLGYFSWLDEILDLHLDYFYSGILKKGDPRDNFVWELINKSENDTLIITKGDTLGFIVKKK